MPKIIIAPYAAKLRNGQKNAKNYPVHWWIQVVAKLNALGCEVVQIGVSGENRIEGVSQFVTNWPMRKLRDLIETCDLWISCDSFLPHFCHVNRLQSGIVIWSVSDPEIFGHPENTNILKDRKYLRKFQFAPWEDEPYNEAAFVLPQVIIDAVQVHLAGVRSANRTGFVPYGVLLAAQSA